MKSRALRLAILLVFSSCALADQVVLKNGDRLSGTIVKSDRKSLILKTDFAGAVTIKWDAIDGVTATEPLHVTLEDGKTAAGPVSLSNGSAAIQSTSGTVTASKDAIVAIRNDAEQTAYEKGLHPGLMSSWAGGINTGFALTRGNSQTKNLNLAFTADRKTSNDHIGLYANSVYASNDAPGAVPKTTANAIRGGLRYDRNLTARMFAYGDGDFASDDLQSLNLRSVFGGGLGVHVIKSDLTTLDLLGGINYTRESYTSLSRNFAAATLGEELLHKWRGNTVLKQKLYFYPDLQSAGDYRGTFDFGTVTKISKWLGWQNAFSDIYVTNPPAGKKKNDILLTTGLNISFTH